MCVYGVVLINILVLQLGPPKQKFLAPPLVTIVLSCLFEHFLFLLGVCIYIIYQIKKCVYNKKSMCIYVCVWSCLDKYISVATWPPKQKFLAPPLFVLSRKFGLLLFLVYQMRLARGFFMKANEFYGLLDIQLTRSNPNIRTVTICVD